MPRQLALCHLRSVSVPVDIHRRPLSISFFVPHPCFGRRGHVRLRGRRSNLRNPRSCPRWHALQVVIRSPSTRLLGRHRERATLVRLLDAARDGYGGALVVYGEPGVGKTALLDSAIEAAAGFRVARATGVEGEVELAFAALQQLCSPSLDRKRVV